MPPTLRTLRTPRASLLLTTTLTACRATLPSDIAPPHPTDAIVAIKSCALHASNPFWRSFAHHAWVDLKRPGSTAWERIESGGHFGILHGDIPTEEARLDHRFGGRTIRLLGHATGDDAVDAIADIDRALRHLAPLYADAYTMWPGPNSNTFVRELCAEAPSLSFVFDPNAVGKDYSLLGIGATASKTGLRIDTPIVGAAIGLREGVELHLLQLTLGISLDPPGLSIPFLPQIPFGFFGASPARLVPPPIEGATTLALDDTTCTGTRITLGTFDGPFTLVFAHPDERGWLRVDGSVHAAPADLRGRDVRLEVEIHEQDGIGRFGAELRSDPLAPPVIQRLQCDAAVVLLELRANGRGAVTVTARCFSTTQHEFDVLSREPHPSPPSTIGASSSASIVTS